MSTNDSAAWGAPTQQAAVKAPAGGILAEIRSIMIHFFVLLIKNMVMMWRRKVFAFLRLTVPSLAVILLFVLKDTVYEYTDWRDNWNTGADPGESVELVINPCSVFYKRAYWDSRETHIHSDDCITLAYSPDDEYHTSIMQYFADKHGFEFSKDIVGMASAGEIAGRMYDSPGTVDMAAVFDNNAENSDTGVTEYQLWYNHTHGRSTDMDYAYGEKNRDSLWKKLKLKGRFAAMQKGLDDAIVAKRLAESRGETLRWSAPDSSPSVGVSLHKYPEGQASLLTLTPPPPATLDSSSAASVTAVRATREEFPEPPGIVPAFGASLLILGMTGVGMLTLLMVVEEKRTGTLGFLRSMGCSEGAYWASWMFAALPFALFQAIITTTVGKLTGLWIFTKVSFSVHLVGFLLYDLCTTAMVLMMAAVFCRPAWVNSMAFFMFASAFIFQSIWTPSSFADYGIYTVGYDMIYSDKTAPAGRFLISLLPFFHYGRIFSTLLEVTAYDERKWFGQPRDREYSWDMVSENKNWTDIVVNHGFQFANCGFASFDDTSTDKCWLSLRYKSDDSFVDLQDPNEKAQALQDNLVYAGFQYKGNFFGRQFVLDDTPGLGHTFGMMVLITAMYAVLAWYLAQVLPSTQGAQQVPWFFVTPEYWGFKRRRDMSIGGDTLAREQQLSQQDKTIRLHKMSMAYDKVTAVKELSLEMRNGEVFCLLGHNGAGKTTAIKVLTGLLTPTHGEVFVFGDDIRTSVAEIRRNMGLCSQDDILFNELTGEEHLWFYGCFRGASFASAREYSDSILADLGLGKDKTRPARDYSGGMKRRLSFAMSTVGDPRAIFLDEPSTGLDPLSRRKVWSVVESLKRSRIVVLTTHSMEEADALGDNIAIMAQGRLRALGTSTFLKEQYGSGYQIVLLVDSEREAQVMEVIQTRLAGAEVTASGGGSITLSLPRRVMGHMGAFFDWMSTQEGQQIVREWGLSNTTLEEVFIRLVNQNKDVNAGLGFTGQALEGDAQVQMLSQELAKSQSEVANLTEAVIKLLRIIFSQTPDLSVLQVEARPLLALHAPDLLQSSQLPASTSASHLPQDTVVVSVVGNTPVEHAGAGVTMPPPPPAPPLGPSHQQQAHSGNPAVPSSQSGENMVSLGAGGQVGLNPASTATPEGTGGGVGGGNMVSGQTIGMDKREHIPTSIELGVLQLRGLLLKNMSYQAKQKKSNCCVACVIIFFVLLSLLTGLFVQKPGRDWLEYKAVFCEHSLGMYSTPGGSYGCNRTRYVEEHLAVGLKQSRCFHALKSIPPTCLNMERHGTANTAGCCGPLESFFEMGCNDEYSTSGAIAPAVTDEGFLNVYNRDSVFGNGNSYSNRDITMYAQLHQCSNIEPYQHQEETADVYYYGEPSETENYPPDYPFAHMLTALYQNPNDPGRWIESTRWPYRRDGGGQYSVPNLWYQDSPIDSDTSLEAYDFLGLGSNTTGVVTLVKKTSADAEVLEAEAEARRLSQSDKTGVCAEQSCLEYDAEEDYCQSQLKGWQLSSEEEAKSELGDRFPDENIRVTASRPGEGTLNWDISGFIDDRLCEPCEVYYVENNGGENSCSDSDNGEDSFCEPGGSSGYCGNMAVRTYSTQDEYAESRAPSPLEYTIHGMSNALLRTALAGETESSSSSSSSSSSASQSGGVGIRTIKVKMSDFSFLDAPPDAIKVFNYSLLTFYMIVTLCMFHTQVAYLVEEFHTGLLHMMVTMGLSKTMYWLSVYVQGVITFGSIAFFFWLIAYGVGIPEFKDAHPSLWILVLLLGSHCQVGFATLFCSLIRRTRVATAGAIMWVLVLAIVSPILVESVDPWPPVLQLIPLFGYAYCVTLMMAHGPSTVAAAPNLSQAVGLTFLSGCLCFLAGQLLMTLWPSKLGTQSEGMLETGPQLLRDAAKSLTSCCNLVAPTKDDVATQPANDVEAGKSLIRSEDTGRVGEKDPELESERSVILSQWEQVSATSALAINHLTKSFPGKGAALSDVAFKVGVGECLGLLGPNGAGKTTLLNILAGNMNPSGGKATVAGYDVQREREKMYAVLGICPQFDVLWMDLTVHEHLLLYARLSGVPAREERARARQVAELVELDGDAFNQRASELSGGMRRRLSIGLSLVGDPKVLFLDEPTTGLDPEMRQQIWRVIEKAKFGRAIVLTTHSMEEADALATRIGIMAAGRMLCIGSQLQLKNRYGEGLLLKVSLAPEVSGESVRQFVKDRVCATARLLPSGNVRAQAYVMPRQERTLVTHVFRMMEDQSSAAGVREWSLSQTSLEDVFINLVTANQQEQA